MVVLDPAFEDSLNKLLLQRSQFIYTREAGKAVSRVLRQCDSAVRTGCLDLSECRLMRVPDAVFYQVRHSLIVSCNFSSNFLSNVSPKLPFRFADLRVLDLSHNKLTRLPDQMTVCKSLINLDISHNDLIQVPHVVFRMISLKHLKASNNFIIEVDLSGMSGKNDNSGKNNKSSNSKHAHLDTLDLRDNPLLPACRQMLSRSSVTVRLTERLPEEWEDLCV